jgi:hypothetical protein
MGALVLSLTVGKVSAATITSTVRQSGWSGTTALPFPLTRPSTPYDFSSQLFANLTSIDSITVTLSMVDGDTGPGEGDFNELTLGLDGIDTGLLLNGFRDNQFDTLTFSGVPQNAAAILSALQNDGRLVGTVIDSRPNDNSIVLPDDYTTTLQIQGPAHAPEPCSVTLVALGLLPLARGLRRRRSC